MSALKEKYVNPLTDFGFPKLFEAAEIARFSPKEKEADEESLKYYRDLKNVVDTSFEEGEAQGLAKGEIKGILKVAAELKKNGISTEVIIKSTGLSRDAIEAL